MTTSSKSGVNPSFETLGMSHFERIYPSSWHRPQSTPSKTTVESVLSWQDGSTGSEFVKRPFHFLVGPDDLNQFSSLEAVDEVSTWIELRKGWETKTEKEEKVRYGGDEVWQMCVVEFTGG